MIDEKMQHSYNIAVAGTGYVGLSLAVLLSQNNNVTAVDILEDRVEKLKRWESPIQDEYIEKYLREHSQYHLNLHFVWNNEGSENPSDSAYRAADYVVIAAPTNYDPQKNYFDTSAVESVIEQVLSCSDSAYIVIKSTVPVGYTESAREKFHTKRILFSPEFLRESKALYDNLYPSRIIVGTDRDDAASLQAAETFAD